MNLFADNFQYYYHFANVSIYITLKQNIQTRYT